MKCSSVSLREPAAAAVEAPVEEEEEEVELLVALLATVVSEAVVAVASLALAVGVAEVSLLSVVSAQPKPRHSCVFHIRLRRARALTSARRPRSYAHAGVGTCFPSEAAGTPLTPAGTASVWRNWAGAAPGTTLLRRAEERAVPRWSRRGESAQSASHLAAIQPHPHLISATHHAHP